MSTEFSATLSSGIYFCSEMLFSYGTCRKTSDSEYIYFDFVYSQSGNGIIYTKNV